MNKSDIGQAFLNREDLTDADFKHNDHVNIVGGLHAGEPGSPVTII